MAQIIKHRRGTLAELNGVTLANGELGIVTGSVTIGDAPIKTAIVVGNTDGTNRLSLARLAQGSGSATLAGKTGGANWNDMIYYDTNDFKLQTLHSTNGVSTLDLTGNIAGGEVGGTLTTTGNLSVQAHISASGKITGSDIYASGGFYGDGSNLTGVAQDIDTLSSYGAATIHQTDDEFLISDNGTEKKITFSNLEDSIFANVSGDATIAAGGGLTIAATSVEGSMLNTNVISGQTAMTGDLADTDELMVSDAGTVKRADFSVVRDAVFTDVSGDATVAAGGALTIAATSVEGSMLNDNVISGQGALGGASVAQADLFMMDDGPGTLKKVTFSNLEDSIFGNVSGDIAIAAGGAATVTGATTNAALTAGVGLSTTSGTFNGGSAVTFALDLSELSDVVIATGDKLAVLDSDGANEQLESVDDLFKIGPALVTEAAIANGDYITFLDGGSTGEAKKEALADLTTLFAGDGLQAASSVMAVDVSDFAGTGLEDEGSENLGVSAAQTSITSIINASLGKIGTAATEEYVTFGTANEVNTFIGNSEILSVSATGIDVTGNATISGNLTVNGTQTTISSSIVDIGDNIIQVNGTPVTYGGIQVKDVTAGQTGSMVWNSTSDYWVAGLSGSEYRVPLQNTTTALTDNRVVLSQGNGRIESSANITDDGSTVDFNDVDLTSLDKLEGVDANTYIDLGGSTLIVTKGTLQPSAHNGNDLGATGTRYKDLWLQGNADLEGDIDVNGTANLDNTDIDGTLDVSGVSDFQSRVDAQASLAVTGSVYVSTGASVAASSASLVSFRNDSNTQLGYLASADTQAVTTGLVGYNTSTGNLTISSVIDGGSF